MSVPPPRLWDLAGVDGLSVARVLFGAAAARLSVWQSLDTEWGGPPCSLLRLCENNFRVGLYGGPPEALAVDLERAAQGRRVWVKPCRMAVLRARDAPETLLPVAAVKPPHRLAGLPKGWAVPVRLEDRAVLLWRHTIAGTTTLEVQTAPADGAAVRETLCRRGIL